MEIAERLRELRRVKGVTQEELASALYVTRQSVYKWETGKALPDIDKFRQLCVYFGVSADEWLLLTPSEPQAASPDAGERREGAAERYAGQAALSPAGKEHQEKPNEAEDPVPPMARKGMDKRVLAAVFCVLILGAALLLGGWVRTLLLPGEIRAWQADGVLPGQWAQLNDAFITERDFVRLLSDTATLRLGHGSPALNAAYETATNERLTREKAAYWLYCAHIWVIVQPEAKLAIDVEATALSSRDLWQDMNALGRACADALTAPWEARLCDELAAVGALFDRYDGTAEMDEEINRILDGRCYSSVAFCLAQRSFATEKPLLETRDGRFRPKEMITALDAAVAARRLYESW